MGPLSGLSVVANQVSPPYRTDRPVVLAGDMNGHVASSNVGYGTHGGFGYGDRNADGSRILWFADRPSLFVCNTLFVKQESQLVTYAAGLLKVRLIILLCDRRTKHRFVMSRSFQMKNVY